MLFHMVSGVKSGYCVARTPHSSWAGLAGEFSLGQERRSASVNPRPLAPPTFGVGHKGGVILPHCRHILK